jgi:hypothetical protein
MSPFLEPITLLKVLVAYAVPLALWGIPLLWRYLNSKPVTRSQIGHATWTIFISGCWILFGNTAFEAYERGMISLPTTIMSEAVLFAIVAGSFHLAERRYLEENKS